MKLEHTFLPPPFPTPTSIGPRSVRMKAAHGLESSSVDLMLAGFFPRSRFFLAMVSHLMVKAFRNRRRRSENLELPLFPASSPTRISIRSRPFRVTTVHLTTGHMTAVRRSKIPRSDLINTIFLPGPGFLNASVHVYVCGLVSACSHILLPLSLRSK